MSGSFAVYIQKTIRKCTKSGGIAVLWYYSLLFCKSCLRFRRDWGDSLMKIYVIPNYYKRETVHSMGRLLSWAEDTDSVIMIAREYRGRIPSDMSRAVRFIDKNDTASIKKCQIIVTIGGDGTLIRNAETATELALPIVGVNTGTLGFLARIEPGEVRQKMDKVLHETEHHIERRMGLTAAWNGNEKSFAINDIVLQKASHGGLASIDVCIGDEIIGRYRSDGVIVTTPTGSTAYAYAAGGPAMHPSVDAACILPICPQNRMNIPLVVNMEKPVTLNIRQGTMRLLADGVDFGAVRKGEKIYITKAAKRLQLVKFDDDWGIIGWQNKVSRL